ncbi:MAG TPA: alpha/beta hydrolase [Actinophytocola sp.]|uniref:alpha/beta fold hydrolase n=1 Tax=Actinophytocola sp. TaxID=1872138 RepID=UPI002DB7C000|nr:alpha/beta hydrolase [Actinophytocola sp.]HEU5471923.1 alpha/beta hydrolase [Actinophytocola sp.]
MPPTPDPSSVRIDGRWAHRDVFANGIRLHVAEAGEGPLVVLLHGFGEFWWTWHHQLTALGDAGFRAVAVDLRGYGDSDKPPRGYDAWTLSGDVAGLIKALGERRAHLVGHGWGGLLAWTVAALHPRLVASVGAVAAPHPLALRRQIFRTALRGQRKNQARAIGELFAAQLPILPERRLIRDGAARVEARMRRLSGPQWTYQPEFPVAVRNFQAAALVTGVAHSALEYYRWAVRAQLRTEGRRFTEAMSRRTEVPVLQLHGALDPVVLAPTMAVSADLAGPDLLSVSLAGAGHYPHLEAPEVTGTILKKFLSGP